jgi:hypothetical protein
VSLIGIHFVGIHFDDPPCSVSPLPYWSLTAYLDETGDLLGYLEWAGPVIQETGAMIYMMRVCHNLSSWNQYQCIDE